MALSRRLARMLRACVASIGPTPGDVLAEMSPEDLQGLAHAAAYHGITGYVHREVVGSEVVPRAELDLLCEQRQAIVRRHLRTIGDLRLLRTVLGEAGVPWLVFKGPALATAVHGSPELRSYRDLDILVPASALGETVRLLESAGCNVPPHDWTSLRQQLQGEIDVFLPSGTHLDLHWHLIARSVDRPPMTIDLDGLFARQRELPTGDDRFTTFSHADTVLHVALHAMLSGKQQLIHMKDLQLLVASSELGLDGLLAHARCWRAELPFRVALVRTMSSIGLPSQVVLPEPTGTERLWERLTRAAERLSPLGRQDGTLSVGRMVSRTVRGDVPTSLRFIARSTSIALEVRVAAMQRRFAPKGRQKARGPEPLTRTSTRERDAFFVAVAQHGTRDRAVARE